MPYSSFIIAIDGPSASGKGTLARALAKKLNFEYLDTGAMYRAFAWQVIKNGPALDNEKEIVNFCRKQKMKFIKRGQKNRIYINGKEVSEKIRTSQVGETASFLSKIAGVRRIMVENQRKIAKGKKVILEGRDIGTVVFPKADCKIYLDASVGERTKRRFKDFKNSGEKLKKTEVKKRLVKRDTRDISRKVAPLRKASDAIFLDSTNLTIPEMVRAAQKIISRKIK